MADEEREEGLELEEEAGKYFDEENPPFRFTRTIDDDDYEIVDEEVGGPTREELEKERERLSRELEMAKEKSRGLGREDLVEILKEVRKNSPNQQALPVQEKTESEEDFRTRLKENLFEGNADELIIEAIQRYGGQATGPLLQGNFEISRELVEKDDELGPIYRDYSEEIEQEINQVPANQRFQIPHIYKRATENAARRHWKELRSKGVEDLVAEKVAEELKKRGLGERGTGSPSGPIYSESSINRPSGGGRGGPGKKRIPKPSEMEKKYADMKGVSWPTLYETLQRKPVLKKQINEGGIPWLR